MPGPKPPGKSWLDGALRRAVRFGHRLRAEWKAGEAEVLQSKGEFDYDAAERKSAARVPRPDWCEVLQVDPTATKEEIQRAYRSLIKRNHPDTAGEVSPEEREAMERETKRLNDAYERAMAQG